VSLYGLTVESGTPLGKWTARGTSQEAPEDAYEREFLHAHSALSAAGFDHYEVSNYGLPKHRARHNSAYWEGAPYLGLGPSAHGFDGAERRWNTEAYARWEQELAEGRDPKGGAEQLTQANRAAETVYLGLRTTSGLSISDAERELTRLWEEAGWVFIDASGRLRCTPLGWLRLDSLAAALTAHRSP
jgi:oxygen-independent coproporphyrinogen-3 oxidase